MVTEPEGGLRLILDGDAIPLDVYLDAMSALYRAILDVDRSLARSDKPLLSWTVDSLSSGSATATVRPAPVHDDVDIPARHADRVRRGYVRSLGILENDGGLPPHLTEATIKDLAAMLERLAPDAVTAVRAVDESSGSAVTLTAEAVQSAKRSVAPARRAIGSVIGRLDTISAHNQLYATVWDEATSRAVRCSFNIDLLGRVKDSFRQRVIASGIVYYREDGLISTMALRDIEVLEAADHLPSVAEMYGSDPNFTGGIAPEDHVAGLRHRRAEG